MAPTQPSPQPPLPPLADMADWLPDHVTEFFAHCTDAVRLDQESDTAQFTKALLRPAEPASSERQVGWVPAFVPKVPTKSGPVPVQGERFTTVRAALGDDAALVMAAAIADCCESLVNAANPQAWTNLAALAHARGLDGHDAKSDPSRDAPDPALAETPGLADMLTAQHPIAGSRCAIEVARVLLGRRDAASESVMESVFAGKTDGQTMAPVTTQESGPTRVSPVISEASVATQVPQASNTDKPAAVQPMPSIHGTKSPFKKRNILLASAAGVLVLALVAATLWWQRADKSPQEAAKQASASALDLVATDPVLAAQLAVGAAATDATPQTQVALRDVVRATSLTAASTRPADESVTSIGMRDGLVVAGFRRHLTTYALPGLTEQKKHDIDGDIQGVTVLPQGATNPALNVAAVLTKTTPGDEWAVYLQPLATTATDGAKLACTLKKPANATSGQAFWGPFIDPVNNQFLVLSSDFTLYRISPQTGGCGQSVKLGSQLAAKAGAGAGAGVVKSAGRLVSSQHPGSSDRGGFFMQTDKGSVVTVVAQANATALIVSVEPVMPGVVFERPVTVLAENGDEWVCGTSEGLDIWSKSQRKLIGRQQNGISSAVAGVSFSPEGMMATVAADSTDLVRTRQGQVPSTRVVATESNAATTAATFGPLMAVGRENGRLEVLDARAKPTGSVRSSLNAWALLGKAEELAVDPASPDFPVLSGIQAAFSRNARIGDHALSVMQAMPDIDLIGEVSSIDVHNGVGMISQKSGNILDVPTVEVFKVKDDGFYEHRYDGFVTLSWMFGTKFTSDPEVVVGLAHHDLRAELWRIKDLAVVGPERPVKTAKISGPPVGSVISRDRKSLLALTTAGGNSRSVSNVSEFDTADLTPGRTWKVKDFGGVDYLADNSTVVLATGDTLSFVERDATVMRTVKVGFGIEAISVSPSGAQIAIAGAGKIRTLSTATWTLDDVAYEVPSARPVRSVSWAHDETLVVHFRGEGTGPGEFYSLRLDLGPWASMACSLAGDRVSQESWKKFARSSAPPGDLCAEIRAQLSGATAKPAPAQTPTVSASAATQQPKPSAPAPVKPVAKPAPSWVKCSGGSTPLWAVRSAKTALTLCSDNHVEGTVPGGRVKTKNVSPEGPDTLWAAYGATADDEGTMAVAGRDDPSVYLRGIGGSETLLLDDPVLERWRAN